ncbi:hypothetical protein [Ornithinibacillus contaminans]|uniref:hypothetical protein n=1 Tax=Ornithinibacillus contaminans TaxID=694055 RepID=UPI00064D74BF|nr:hypothetical protein [Ornithinibacillus contaminans]
MKPEKLLKNLGVIEKHLEKNEKWLKNPEKRMITFEKQIGEWNTRYLQTINEVDYWMKALEKKMES